MFLKRYSFFFLLFIIACNATNKKVSTNNFIVDTNKVNNFISEKKPELLYKYADSSFSNADIAENDLLSNSLMWLVTKAEKNGFDWKFRQSLYKKLFHLSENYSDTSSTKNKYFGFYKWAKNSFQHENRIDDSVIVCLEKAVSGNKQYNFLPQNEKGNAFKILGISYNQIGDLKKTLLYYDLESKEIEKNIKLLIGNTINRSIVLNELGKSAEAYHLIQSVLDSPNISPIPKADLFTILSTSKKLQHNYTGAMIDITSAIKILDTITNQTPHLQEKKAQAYKQKGILLRLNNQNDLAIQTHKLAVEYYKKTGINNGRWLSKLYTELGKSFEAAQHFDSALFYYHKALQKIVALDSSSIYLVPQKVFAENSIVEACDAKANLFEKLFLQTQNEKYLTAAIDNFKTSFDVEKKLLQNFSYDESRMAMLTTSKQRSKKAIEICYQLLYLTKNEEWAAKAFQFAESSKALILLESIKRNIAANKVLEGDSTYNRIQYLTQRLTSIETQLALTKNDSLINVLIEQKKIVEKEILASTTALNRTNSTYNFLATKEDSLSEQIIQQKILDEETSLIEFFDADSSTFVFCFEKNKPISFYKLDNGITTQLQNFLQFFAAKNKINDNPSLFETTSNSLYNKLSPIFSSSSNKLVIIPDGKFNLLPFDALTTSTTNQQNPKQFTYLLTQKEITYNYSVATILKQFENTATNSGQSIVCFAPIFTNSERNNQPLLFSEGEINSIKQNISDGKYFLNQTASLQNFKTELNNAAIIHIATHANADTALKNQPKIELYDSALFLNELYAMHFNPKLIVLSACQTGIGNLNANEGALSLARGFYYAGAKNIITSLWEINDKSTALVFENFYKSLPNKNYSLSLQQAKLSYLKNSTAATASPYFWAGFVHIGNSIPKSQYNFLPSIICLSALILLVLFFFYKKK